MFLLIWAGPDFLLLDRFEPATLKYKRDNLLDSVMFNST